MPATSLITLNSICARDAMRAPIVGCRPDADLGHIARLMTLHHVHAVIVDGILGGQLVWSVVTDRDLIGAALDELAPGTAGRAAHTEALTVDAGDDLALVSRRLAEHSCSHAVVVDGELPVGVISTLDIVAAIAALDPASR